jgi:peroxiredoxin
MRLLKSSKILAATLLSVLLALPAVSFALPQTGQPAPPFHVVSTSGQKISLANYKGYVLVLEFFATWCGGCKESIPHLMDLQKKYGKQGLQILGLDVGQGDDNSDLRDFVVNMKLTYPVGIAGEDVVYDNYGIRMIPTVFVISKKGTLVEKFSGFNADNLNELEGIIKKQLAE